MKQSHAVSGFSMADILIIEDGMPLLDGDTPVEQPIDSTY